MDNSAIQLFAALASAIAAIAAAVATWRGPSAAARLAEKLRQQSEANADARRFRINVFATIMQERACLYSIEGVRALNSIDVAFAECAAVREAWAELYQAFAPPMAPGHVQEERVRKLLREMATELGIADRLRLDDFGRIYYPEALQKERHIRDLQREASLKNLLGQTSPGANTSIDIGVWPPKPE